jgi:hypothetical protein
MSRDDPSSSTCLQLQGPSQWYQVKVSVYLLEGPHAPAISNTSVSEIPVERQGRIHQHGTNLVDRCA